MTEQTALTGNAVETILKAAAQPSASIIDVSTITRGALPLLMTPNGYSAQILDNLEKHLPAPLRKTGAAKLDDLDSFVWYVKEHGNAARCRIYTSVDYKTGELRFKAVFNDHEQETAAWRDFSAAFSPALSLEWQRWTSNNRKAMSQSEFAVFIEDNLPEIATIEGLPTGTDMLQLATNFEATSDKKFKAGHRLQSGGVSIEYIDQEDAGTLARMQVFEKFALGMPVYFNDTPYRIDARLKYRVREGKLALWYELIRPETIIEHAARELIDSVRNQSGMPVLFGIHA